jgi:uncharacterized glyoxalase superfamily protein PhnB
MARKRPTKKRSTRPSARARKKPAARANSSRKARPRQEPETLRLRTLEPTLTADDLDRSLRFYTDALGFIVANRWTDDGGALRGVTLKAGVCQLNLSQDDWAKGRDRKKGEGLRLWCKTAQNIDELAQRIKSAGEKLVEEPDDLPWGGRSLSVDDPTGYHLTIYSEK